MTEKKAEPTEAGPPVQKPTVRPPITIPDPLGDPIESIEAAPAETVTGRTEKAPIRATDSPALVDKKDSTAQAPKSAEELTQAH